MADERNRDPNDDVEAEGEGQAGEIAPPSDRREIAGDADARRLEITPDRPDRRPSSS